HPAMVVSHNLHGSVVLDIDGQRLDATFLTKDGQVLDRYRMDKAVACTDPDGDGVCGIVDNCPSTSN
ncbi:MAG: hypothetical protein GWN46_17085, partial [Gammaproteobacteria bacterium]|nr:hypothetical protein [Gammaproteobacteria bacterium]